METPDRLQDIILLTESVDTFDQTDVRQTLNTIRRLARLELEGERGPRVTGVQRAADGTWQAMLDGAIVASGKTSPTDAAGRLEEALQEVKPAAAIPTELRP
jgi:hypothetical protein